MMNDDFEVTEDMALVKAVNGRKVTVEMQRNPGCSSCRAHSLCIGTDRPPTHVLDTDVPLRVGDRVKVGVSPGVKMMSSFMLFIFPLLMMFLFYGAAKLGCRWSEDLSILCSLGGLLISGVLVKVFDRKYAKKIHFEILEKIEEAI
jgi:positive regulator of sigma E activity